MKKRITKISVLQTSKVAAMLYACFGVIVGFLQLLIAVVAEKEGEHLTALSIVTPVFYWLGAFIGTVLATLFYNFLAKRMGGIECTVATEPFPATIPLFSFQEDTSRDVETEVRRLAKLKEDGLLTEAEFTQKKRSMLGI